MWADESNHIESIILEIILMFCYLMNMSVNVYRWRVDFLDGVSGGRLFFILFDVDGVEC